jgi:pentatricopeptide repeat protein
MNTNSQIKPTNIEIVEDSVKEHAVQTLGTPFSLISGTTTSVSVVLILVFFVADSLLGSADGWTGGARRSDDSLGLDCVIYGVSLLLMLVCFFDGRLWNNKTRAPSCTIGTSPSGRKRRASVKGDRRSEDDSTNAIASSTNEKNATNSYVNALVQLNQAIDAAARERDAEKAGKLLVAFEQKSQGKTGPMPDVISYNLVIRAYCKSGDFKGAEAWLNRMDSHSVNPTVCTYNTLLDACAKMENPEAAESWFRKMVDKGIQANAISYATVIYARARRGDEKAAERWLQDMLASGIKPDPVCYNCMIHACSSNGNAAGAERWIQEMHTSGLKASVTSFTAVIDTCAKALDVPRAEKWLEAMIAAEVQPNVVTFSAMIDACAKSGDVARAEHWHDRMIQCGIEPNAYSFSAVINACAKAGNVGRAEFWLGRSEQAGVANDVVVYSSVIDACGKVGDAERAIEIFARMRANGIQPHIVAYAALARPFSHRGDWAMVEQIADRMTASGIKPNEYFTYAQLLSYAIAKPKQVARAEDCFRRALDSGLKVNDHVVSALSRAVGRQHCQSLMTELCNSRPVPLPPPKKK